MEGGAVSRGDKAEFEVAGPVGPVSIFSRPRRWAGEPPSGRFFLAISRSLFESDNLKEVGENYFEATHRILCCRAARICTQINFPPPGSH